MNNIVKNVKTKMERLGCLPADSSGVVRAVIKGEGTNARPSSQYVRALHLDVWVHICSHLLQNKLIVESNIKKEGGTGQIKAREGSREARRQGGYGNVRLRRLGIVR